MASLSVTEVDNLIGKSKNYDYIRFTWADTNGIPRCKTSTRKSFADVVRSGGPGICKHSVTMGCDSQQILHPQFVSEGFPDFFLVPIPTTLKDCPWASDGKRMVGQVLCEAHDKEVNYPPNMNDTRYLCCRILKQLKNEFGFELMSALEYEFCLLKDGKMAFEGSHFYSSVVFKEVSDFHFEIAERLEKSDVQVELLQIESDIGQSEITLKPEMGVKAGDHAFLLKQCVKETAVERSYQATFMYSPFAGVEGGGHFNHSMWKEGKNVFYDSSHPAKLSKIALHWIAGIFESIDAISAFSNPTNNCYIRAAGGLSAPVNVCFEVENRMCAIRVKFGKSNGSYLEFRPPVPAANPYLVMAAVTAAGMHGLRNNLEPPEAGFSDARKIPANLNDALNALENDVVMREAFGDDFIFSYLLLKRENDLPVTTREEQFEIYSQLI